MKIEFLEFSTLGCENLSFGGRRKRSGVHEGGKKGGEINEIRGEGRDEGEKWRTVWREELFPSSGYAGDDALIGGSRIGVSFLTLAKDARSSSAWDVSARDFPSKSADARLERSADAKFRTRTKKNSLASYLYEYFRECHLKFLINASASDPKTRFSSFSFFRHQKSWKVVKNVGIWSKRYFFSKIRHSVQWKFVKNLDDFRTFINGLAIPWRVWKRKKNTKNAERTGNQYGDLKKHRLEVF